MKIETIRELMEAFQNSNILKMKLTIEDFHLELEKEKTFSKESKVGIAVPQTQPVEIAPTVTAEEVRIPVAETGFQVKSPIVGTYYSAPSPDAPPFVKIGSHVNKGQVLCIVEAMKMMNEISAPVDGTVKKIFAENGDLLHFDAIIMEIEED